MSGYTKLFTSILDSSIWDADCSTRILWITMLAMVNKSGQVLTSVKNLSLRARLPLADVNKSLEVLLAPDPLSRTSNDDGRRLETIDGGWKLVNYHKYRNKQQRADYMRDYMRNYRAVNKNGKPVNSSLVACKQVLAKADATAYTTSPTPPSKEGFVNFQSQELKTQPLKCGMPGCDKPAPPGQRYCCEAHRDYADFLESKYGSTQEGKPS